MKFEEAAALKVLFDTEEVQVVTRGREFTAEDGEEEPVSQIVEGHGIIDIDEVYWDIDEAIEHLANRFGYYRG